MLNAGGAGGNNYRNSDVLFQMAKKRWVQDIQRQIAHVGKSSNSSRDTEPAVSSNVDQYSAAYTPDSDVSKLTSFASWRSSRYNSFNSQYNKTYIQPHEKPYLSNQQLKSFYGQNPYRTSSHIPSDRQEFSQYIKNLPSPNSYGTNKEAQVFQVDYTPKPHGGGFKNSILDGIADTACVIMDVISLGFGGLKNLFETK